ncbi:hypothetical protein [Limoniibacter endophyticus]|uniref:Glycosyl transferase n=1 Tax=Limoniibacter endophyticus TaxID=1565040 RepID=A0A8J3DH76_9HYPH|nr:hypothetical protein [Limoniibacter endophyticus]GHC71307.1 glycosyl transferase [Limoniibacter endophyticus]
MLSVVVVPADDPEALARTLAVLVEGVLEGVICEAFVIDEGLEAASLEVADQAGCMLMKNRPAEIAAAMRGEWLLVLEAGAIPGEGWVQALSLHMASACETASFRHERWWGNLGLRFLRRPLAFGLLVKRRRAMEQAEKGFEVIARGARLSIAATIVPAEGESRKPAVAEMRKRPAASGN